MDDLIFKKPEITTLFQRFLGKGRCDSAAFLMWYLENYYRLESNEAIDYVCDQPGDKGVDGIVVNDNDETITIFQSRIYNNAEETVGDNPLRTLAGTITQFETPDKIYSLIETGGNAKVSALARYLELTVKIAEGYDLRGVFLCNVSLHKNGADFLEGARHIEFVGAEDLRNRYTPDSRAKPIHEPIVFSLHGFNPIEYSAGHAKAVIAPIKALELVKMSGIHNQSLFHYNVRAPLGKTAVNRAIAKTIQNKGDHESFPLFHNGITIIAKKIEIDGESVSIEDYFVVNGCQSLTALYDNLKFLTENLRVLTKLVQMEPESEIAAQVTRLSNNQNGVSSRDFKSNNRIQIRLQKEMESLYGGEFAFEIKRGELLKGREVIENQDAGLLLVAFDLKEPWATHRGYQVFEERHGAVFGRREVTADRIVLCTVIRDKVKEALPKLQNELFSKYSITVYFLVYVLRLILEKDELGREVLNNPQTFVRSPEARIRFQKCLDTILTDVMVDLDAEINSLGEDFDYRDKLRDKDWVVKLGQTLVKERDKQIVKQRTDTFKVDWEKKSARQHYDQ